MLLAQGLETRFADVAAALSHLGYVQIDPLNICGRMHDLILRNRVAGYREGDLMRHIHAPQNAKRSAKNQPEANAPTLDEAKRPASPPASAAERVAFEHHHPTTNILVAFPLAAWPHLLGAMRARARSTGAWSGRLTPRERELAPTLLAEIAARGPLGSEDFDDDRRAHRVVWGAATLVKSTLQKLFFHGRLLIAQRDNHRRRYDLPDRVLPAPLLAQPEAPASDTARWLADLKLRQRRLAILTRDEQRAIGNEVQPVTVAGCPTLYCLKEDAPLLEAGEALDRREASSPDPASARLGNAAPEHDRPAGGPRSQVQLLAPLDPLIYDRRVTAALWHFDYTWEAYTPAAKRVRGHYALPVLAGTELVGHVEPKADRKRGTLVVASRAIRRGYATRDALDELAGWLGLAR